MSVKNFQSEIEKALKSLEQQRGDQLVARIKPIIFANLDRGRIEGFIAGDAHLIGAYVSRVSDHYIRLHVYIDKVQVERTPEVWEPLFQKLQEWAYNFLLRNNFNANQTTKETATDCGTSAATTLIDAHFPYDTEFEPWAHVITRNACLKFFRDETKKSVIPPQNIVELKETLTNIDDSILFGQKQLEDRNEILSALDQLSEARKKVIELYYFHEWPLPKIAETMGKSVGAVHSLHFNALQDLRKILGTNRDNI